MSIARKITEGASGSGGSGSYVDDVFSTYLYEGTSADQDIVNGIDLDDKGGLVWIKVRSAAAWSHELFDTERGAFKTLRSNSSSEENDYTGIQAGVSSFNSDGFSVTSSQSIGTNVNNEDMASWTFAKQEGFFDIVTWTGDDVVGREIPHNLGSKPGMIIVKVIDGGDHWYVYHKSTGATNYLVLNLTNAASPWSVPWNNTEPTDSVFTVGGTPSVNGSSNGVGYEYVAYVFADDAPMFGPNGDESIIKCGSYAGNDSSDGPEIDLGWEPQWVLIKSSNGNHPWMMVDNMRGIVNGGNDPYIESNSSAAEASVAQLIDLNPTGFKLSGASNYTNGYDLEYIYMAIRRPNKPAEEFEPEELFDVAYGDGSGSPDFKGPLTDFRLSKDLTSSSSAFAGSRVQGTKYLQTANSEAESNAGYSEYDYMDGWGSLGLTNPNTSWMFRRAPGFFDVVAYEGDGTTGGIAHNLAAVPEMYWIKRTNYADGQGWMVYHKDAVATTAANAQSSYLTLNSTDTVAANTNRFGNIAPTTTTFGVSSSSANETGADYIAFLWASVPGICDIGSYTGTGADRDIDCGFTNGARFVLIKQYEGGAGSWYYFDTLRGIVTRSSPYLLLNATQPQSTNAQSSVSPLASGFSLLNSLDSEATNYLNTTGHKYIYMAIA